MQQIGERDPLGDAPGSERFDPRNARRRHLSPVGIVVGMLEAEF